MAQGPKKKAARKRTAADTEKAELATRIAMAFKRFNANAPIGKELLQADLGRMVAARLKLEKPITQAAVSRWMNPSDPSEPDSRTIGAIADILGVDRAWLAWGGESG